MPEKEKTQTNPSDQPITSISRLPKPEFRQGISAQKYHQTLVDKNKEAIEKILERVRDTNSHAC